MSVLQIYSECIMGKRGAFYPNSPRGTALTRLTCFYTFSKRIRAYQNNCLTAQRMKPDRCTGAAPLRPNLILRQGIPDRL